MGSFFYSFEIINNIVPCLLCCIANFVLGRNRCFLFYHSFWNPESYCSMFAFFAVLRILLMKNRK
jgi:hypothetical protein